MTVPSTSESSVRFEFGENWRSYLAGITDARIAEAERSLREMLGVDDLNGRRFLDIGCGSGLFSLAARRLGASVHSFDYDAVSVACAQELKRRYCADDPAWSIARESVLDSAYMRSLGGFDVVYSWGVLHHTGSMWSAIDHACSAVGHSGELFIAIYNDQGIKSRLWTRVKRLYNQLPQPLRTLYLWSFGVALELGAFALSLIRLQPNQFINRWTKYDNIRGMSRWHDVVDWVGGYPFEVATPKAIVEFCAARGVALTKLKTCGTKMGCNEFVFRRS